METANRASKTSNPKSVLPGIDVDEEKATRLQAYLLWALISCDIHTKMCD